MYPPEPWYYLKPYIKIICTPSLNLILGASSAAPSAYYNQFEHTHNQLGNACGRITTSLSRGQLGGDAGKKSLVAAWIVIVNPPKQPPALHISGTCRIAIGEGVSSWLNNKSVIGGTTDEAPLVVYNSFAFQLICDCCSSIKDYPTPYLQEKSTGRKEGSKQVEWRPLIRTNASYAEIQLECKFRGTTGDP